MSKKKSIAKNFIMNAMLSMSAFIFPLITFPYVSRVLLPTGTGKVALATSFIAYFNMVAQLGIPTYGVRACAKVRDDRKQLTKTAHELLIINLIMSVLSYVALAACIIMIPKLREEKALYIVVSLTIILTAIGMEWLYKALEQYTYITLRSILFKFIAVLAMFVLIHSKKDYVIYGGISIFAASASNVMNLINAHKYIDIKPLGKYEIKKHFKPVLVFFAMACATTVYTNLDSVMLGFMKSDDVVGYYNAAVKIKSILVSVVTSLGAVLLPRCSYYIERNMKEDFLNVSKKAMNFVLLIAVPMVIYFIIYASEGIFLLSGKEYAGSIVPMQIIMPTLLFIGMTNLLGIQMLVPMGKENLVLYSVIVGSIVDVILNIIFIPQYGTAGAAFGTLVAEIAVWITQLIFMKDMLSHLYSVKSFIKILLAATVSAALSYGFKLLDLNVFVALALSATVYFSSYLLIMILLKETLVTELINAVIKKIKK